MQGILDLLRHRGVTFVANVEATMTHAFVTDQVIQRNCGALMAAMKSKDFEIYIAALNKLGLWHNIRCFSQRSRRLLGARAMKVYSASTR